MACLGMRTLTHDDEFPFLPSPFLFFFFFFRFPFDVLPEIIAKVKPCNLLQDKFVPLALLNPILVSPFSSSSIPFPLLLSSSLLNLKQSNKTKN
eukprot:m.127432 g.127432  ORF g.127432 m.127432 type:complete len:94 (+) comp23544_c3_seq4:275-556(+)